MAKVEENTNMTQENAVKEEIIATLKKTGRNGMDDLIAYMEEIGFFTARHQAAITPTVKVVLLSIP